MAGLEKKKSQGQKRRDRRKRMKAKLKDNEEIAKVQEVTIQEDVSTDAEVIEDVFDKDLETDQHEINPRTRLRVRSTKLVVCWRRRGCR